MADIRLIPLDHVTYNESALNFHQICDLLYFVIIETYFCN